MFNDLVDCSHSGTTVKYLSMEPFNTNECFVAIFDLIRFFLIKYATLPHTIEWADGLLYHLSSFEDHEREFLDLNSVEMNLDHDDNLIFDYIFTYSSTTLHFIAQLISNYNSQIPDTEAMIKIKTYIKNKIGQDEFQKIYLSAQDTQREPTQLRLFES